MFEIVLGILVVAVIVGCVDLVWLYAGLAGDYARLDDTADGLRRERDRLAASSKEGEPPITDEKAPLA